MSGTGYGNLPLYDVATAAISSSRGSTLIIIPIYVVFWPRALLHKSDFGHITDRISQVHHKNRMYCSKHLTISHLPVLHVLGKKLATLPNHL